MKYIYEKLTSNNLKDRICWAAIFYSIVFFGITILSYYLLPEGLLKNRNPLQNWETSENSFMLVLQIFFYNFISVTVIIIGSLFSERKDSYTGYFSLGYYALLALFCVNGTVLGTWSFSVESEPIPLLSRIIRTFDLAHRAGLWEMAGQLLITCSTAHIAIVLTSGKNTMTRKLRDIRLGKSERIALITGIVLLLIGAIVESTAINAQ